MNTTDQDRTGIGGNNPPPAEVIAERATNLIDTATRWLNERQDIETDDQATALADFIKQIGVARRSADESRRAEKLPHTAAGRAVDEAYHPTIKKLLLAESLMKDSMSRWFQVKEAAQRELVAAAQAEARRQQAAADEAAAAAKRSNDQINAQVAAEAQAKAADEAAKAAARLAKDEPTVRGKFTDEKVVMKTVKTVEVTDWEELYMRYSENTRVKDILRSLAEAEVRSKDGANEFKGVTVTITKEVR